MLCLRNGLSVRRTGQLDSVDRRATTQTRPIGAPVFHIQFVVATDAGFQPRSGTLNYAYEMTVTCKPRQMHRSIATTYSYDGMHRLLSKSYSNGTLRSRYLDQAACLGQPACANVGRRTGMTDVAGSEAWSYDVVGRPLADQRTTNGVTKTTISPRTTGDSFSAHLSEYTVVTYSYDAGGRVVSGVDSAFGIQLRDRGALTHRAVIGQAGRMARVWFDVVLQQPTAALPHFGEKQRYSRRAVVRCCDIGNVLDFNYNFSLGIAITVMSRVTPTTEIQRGRRRLRMTPRIA